MKNEVEIVVFLNETGQERFKDKIESDGALHYVSTEENLVMQSCAVIRNLCTKEIDSIFFKRGK